MLRAVVCACAATLGVAGTARAQSSDNESAPLSAWSFSGFGTLGVVHQTGGADWGFQRNSNQVGTSSHRLSATPDSRIGVQANWSRGPDWDGAIQAVWLNYPSGTPPVETVQYAYLGYRALPDTRIRLGRTSPDIFLFADSRNVGFALPWVRPPVDFYGFVPLAAIDGADLEQRWSSGDATWRARATFGQVRTSSSGVDGSRQAFQGRPTLTLGLTREEGGLVLKLSFLRTRLTLDTGPDAMQLADGLDQIGSLPVPGLADTVQSLKQNLWSQGPCTYVGLGMQYETGPWSLIAEGSQLWVPDSPIGTRRGYVSVGWRHGPVTYFALASRAKPTSPIQDEPDLATPLTPVVGAELAQQAQALAGYAIQARNNYRTDQSTLGVGLRWDFATNAALKVQLDHFDVRRQGGSSWRYYDGTAASGNLLSVAVDFVLGH